MNARFKFIIFLYFIRFHSGHNKSCLFVHNFGALNYCHFNRYFFFITCGALNYHFNRISTSQCFNHDRVCPERALSGAGERVWSRVFRSFSILRFWGDVCVIFSDSIQIELVINNLFIFHHKIVFFCSCDTVCLRFPSHSLDPSNPELLSHEHSNFSSNERCRNTEVVFHPVHCRSRIVLIIIYLITQRTHVPHSGHMK